MSEQIITTVEISKTEWFDWEHQMSAVVTRIMRHIEKGNNPIKVQAFEDENTVDHMMDLRWEIAQAYVGDCIYVPRKDGGIFTAYREYTK